MAGEFLLMFLEIIESLYYFQLDEYNDLYSLQKGGHDVTNSAKVHGMPLNDMG